MNVSITVASACSRTLGARRRLCRAVLLVCLPAAAFLAAHAAGDGIGVAARPPTFENRSISLPRPPVSIPALPAFGALPDLRVPPPVLPALPIAPPTPADPPAAPSPPSAVPPRGTAAAWRRVSASVRTRQ